MEYAIVSIILVVMVVGLVWGRSNEKKEWNNGINAHNGKPWKQFDTDSQGGRGYTDDEGSRYIWISWGFDH